MPSPSDTSDSLKPACQAAQIIESIEKLREEMNMSPETSKLASRLRNQASAAVARGQDQLDNGDNIELAWNFFQMMIEKSKKHAAEQEERQNKIAQTEQEIEIAKRL